MVMAAWWMAFWLRFNLSLPPDQVSVAAGTGLIATLCLVLGLGAANVYRQVWRFTGLPELRQLGWGVLLGTLLTTTAVLMLRYSAVPRSVLVLHPLICLVFLGAARVGSRMVAERALVIASGRRPLLIIGTMQDASDALRRLKGSGQWSVVGIVSPVRAERGLSLQDVPVLGAFAALASIARSTGADTALVASALGSAQRREALLQSADAGVTLLAMPRPDEWLSAGAAAPRKIELEDLLGRDPVQLDVAGLADLFSGQTVLVTGAGGSIGSELCRQIARFGVGRLVCVDVSEIAVYRLEQELRAAHPQMQGLYYTANVRESQRLEAICRAHQPIAMFHAAAYKHVPLMEDLNEIEALRTNVLGTINAARAAAECGARRFVLVSTDKAVNPTNIMGASKRLAERAVQAQARRYPDTEFVSVRFGNVLGSSGSVVPLFSEQIARGGPVTVTHPDIVRYFMTIPEAAQLVLQAGLMGRSGQIFVLDMGEPVKILELARMLIRLSGKTEHEVPIAFTGLRPGEKLFEELLADSETSEPTPHIKLRVAKDQGRAMLELESIAAWIMEAGPAPDSAVIRAWLKAQVPEYATR